MNYSPGSVSDSLRRLQAAPRITLALRDAEVVSMAAARTLSPAADARTLRDAMGDGDDLTTLAAIHAMGAIPDDLADRTLLEVLRSGEEPFVGHAAWSMAARRSTHEAMSELVSLIANGGFSGMLAERTLIEWSRLTNARAIWMLRTALASADQAQALRLASALASLQGSGSRSESAGRDHLRSGTGDGRLVVIQPFLHARLDQDGSSLGAGDGGGIASLLRSLGSALAAEGDIAEVITITRAHRREDSIEPLSGFLADGHRIERIDFGPNGVVPWRDAWQYRTLLEREMTAIGAQLCGRRVVWHLRMAEVGTLAAAAAARRLGHRVVFTAAPDPHVVIDALEASGRLDRGTFGAEDAASQYWFRARMVERLSAQVDHLALLPRPTIQRELVELVGLDGDDLDSRSTVIPEGVDIGEIDRAIQRRADGVHAAAVDAVLSGIPEARRSLPWVLTVGRLSPLKGPHRIVDSVVGSPELSTRFNVVMVGGELADPSPEERMTIALIDNAMQDAAPGAVSIIGHLRPTDIADLLVHAAAHSGLYVCASDKEEFGLAIVEALAAGLPVVAPQRGGPRTYVTDDENGVLCETTSVPALRAAIERATALTGDVERADASRAFVRADLSVDRMAARLGEVYTSIMPRQSAAA